MINRQALLADLQKFLQRIEADLLERSESTEVPEVPAALRAEYEKASRAERTAQNYEDWRTDTITQAAAAWVLSCVFVRFLEDNSLIDPPKIAGPGERLARARDEHELYFRSHPQHTDREYLLSIFGELAKLPGTRDIFGVHNAINDLPNWLSGDAAGELLNFFQKIDASTGNLVHDFTDPSWDTRFLGDLYQDLSEAARKKFALLQTPDFVEEFILDRTLEPAIDEFGLIPKPSGSDARTPASFKMIDPACGSGHFLLGAFPRLLNRWQSKDPGTNIRELTQRALDSIYGVDINPFAVAIGRFRLLLVAMSACSIHRLKDSPAFRIHVACGDSLLHGENRTSSGQLLWDYAEGATDEELYSHAYPGEDLANVREYLKASKYHCVVANPPYIVPKDRKLSDWYRRRFSTCHMQYSLAVPFMQQIYLLASQGGFTGQITANSFMKREFGKKLIESFFPTIDLTHVIDTSGAYIPGHGTPTTILFGRNKPTMSKTLRTVLGIRGEPSTPSDPASGFVWSSIMRLIDHAGEQDVFVSSGDSERALFHKHPWSIGGGGAAELKQTLANAGSTHLEDHIESIGRTTAVGEDDAWLLDHTSIERKRLSAWSAKLVLGEMVRDWINWESIGILYPYDQSTREIVQELSPHCLAHLWPYKALLQERRIFGKSLREQGKQWYVHLEHYVSKMRTPMGLGTANIATHLHFYLDRSGSLFNSTAPVVKLVPGSTEEDYLALLGLLNSSSACFWMKQVAHQKQMMGGDGIRIESKAKVPYAFAGTQLGQMPIPEQWGNGDLRDRLIRLAKDMDELATELVTLSPVRTVLSQIETANQMRMAWHNIQERRKFVRSQMVKIQEEIDYTLYVMWGLAAGDLLSDQLWDDVVIDIGDRPFDILRGKNEDDYPVPNEVPSTWPLSMREIWKKRIDTIKATPELRLIEEPHYKRRWIGRQGLFNHTRNKSELDRECENWLLRRLETYFDFDGRLTAQSSESIEQVGSLVPFSGIAIYSIALLADAARRDPQFMEVGELYRDDPAFDVQALIEELVLAESVPHLPILRYKDSGLRKRAEWEKTWDLQRREDDIDAELKSAQESLKLAEQCVREKFNSELEELGKMRARLLEATTQAYIDLGQEVPSYEPKYEAEIHASVLLNHIGVKTMATAMTLNSAKDEAFKFQGDLDHKIRVACNEDITVLKCHNRLRAIPDRPEILVPPKYTSADFISTGGARYWSLRGKLDVPKERWISFPHCEGPDGTLVICWAGYDHLQQAQAISAYYIRVQTEFGGSDDPRLIPLLASLIELLPWLKQWHNEPNANFDGLRMGDYFESFVNEEARNLGKTLAEIKAWVPPVRTATRSRKKTK